MLNNKTKYALLALVHLARSNAEKPVHVEQITGKGAIPKKFLELILLELKGFGVVESRRGKNGGYMLAKPPEEISIGEIIRFFDGPLALQPCASVTRFKKCKECRDFANCQIKYLFRKVRDKTSEILDGTTLKDLTKEEKWKE